MYHRIARETGEDFITVTMENFRQQMAYLAERDYTVLPLREIVTAFRNGNVYDKSTIAITFDDGFESTFEHAVPMLQERGMTATLFLVTRFVGKTSEWIVSGADARYRLLSWRQAVELYRQGFELGSHSCSHPKLTEIDVDRIRMEVVDSKSELECRLGAPVHAFAYPFGAFDERVCDLVRVAGYESACSTISGFNNPKTDLFSLRRIDIFGTDSLVDFRRKLAFGANRVKSREVLSYYLSRVSAGLLGN
jgi:peptidoglycan/xylan/chitin deacetylase (PgdA/CDA1 family)